MLTPVPAKPGRLRPEALFRPGSVAACRHGGARRRPGAGEPARRRLRRPDPDCRARYRRRPAGRARSRDRVCRGRGGGGRGAGARPARGGGGGADRRCRRCAALARESGVRLLGPGSFGLAVPAIGLNATTGHLKPAPGRVALVAQSVAAVPRGARLGGPERHRVQPRRRHRRRRRSRVRRGARLAEPRSRHRRRSCIGMRAHRRCAALPLGRPGGGAAAARGGAPRRLARSRPDSAPRRPRWRRHSAAPAFSASRASATCWRPRKPSPAPARRAARRSAIVGNALGAGLALGGRRAARGHRARRRAGGGAGSRRGGDAARGGGVGAAASSSPMRRARASRARSRRWRRRCRPRRCRSWSRRSARPRAPSIAARSPPPASRHSRRPSRRCAASSICASTGAIVLPRRGSCRRRGS